jgi:hypothetical protein
MFVLTQEYMYAIVQGVRRRTAQRSLAQDRGRWAGREYEVKSRLASVAIGVVAGLVTGAAVASASISGSGYVNSKMLTTRT